MTRLAVIGVGHWGKNLARVFSELGVLAAISDTSLTRANEISSQHKVAARSFEEILTDTTITAVAIASPAIHHYELSKAALQAHKHVFVEKPLALHTNEASELCNLAQTQNRTFMVGHLLQYHPAYLELKSLCKQGKLGRIQYIYSHRLNLGKIRRVEDSLWSFAPHDISMILGIVGEQPNQVNAIGGYYLHNTIADTTMTHLSFPGGEKAHIFVSWLHPFKEQKLVVIGTDAMAVFDDNEEWGQKLAIYAHKINWLDGIPTPEKSAANYISLPPQEPLQIECKHFLDCILNNTMPITNGHEGLNVLRVLNKASEDLINKQYHSTPTKNRTCFIHETASIHETATIGPSCKIWHNTQILANTLIGKNTIIGQNNFIGEGVHIGDNCKLQNNVSVFQGVKLANGVFCGPGCTFTNVKTPRATINRRDEFQTTIVNDGASIGANATIICGNIIGSYALVGAGSVVTKNVPSHALVVGNPAKQIGWVSHAGEILDKSLRCPKEGRQYTITEHGLVEQQHDKKVSIKEPELAK